MMRILLLYFLLPSSLFAQFTDDFNDGNFTLPAWTGDTAHFAVINEILQLQAPGPGSSSLFYFRPTAGHQEHEWSFRLKLVLSPSSQNYGRYYLYADHSDPGLMQEALYLQLGESGSNDAPELRQLTAGTTTVLARGIDGSIAINPDNIYTLQCDSNYYWTLWTEDMSENKILQFVIQQNQVANGSFAGWQCTYTSSNTGNFYLDDVYDGLLRYDTVPPALLHATAVSQDTVLVTWNEPVDLTNTSFQINGASCAQYSVVNASAIKVNYTPGFQNGQQNYFVAHTVRDAHGNIKPADSIPFTYIHAIPVSGNQIRISELMADPQHANQLPEAEYIELVNISGDYLLTDSLQLTDGTSFSQLTADTIAPGGYLVYSNSTGATLLKHAGVNAHALSNFPSLNNSGDTIRLLNPSGLLLEEVIYSASTYQDALKSSGGWSLEKIDINYPCGSGENWMASKDISGGTPGRINSIAGIFQDQEAPCIDYATMPDSLHILVHFTERMDPALLINPGSYLLTPGIITVTSVIIHSASDVLIKIDQPVKENIIITLRMDENIADCSGNKLGSCNTVKTGRSRAAVSGEILINEILFHSYDGSSDFIEIINTSEQVIALDSLRISRRDDSGALSDMVYLTTRGRCLLPGEIMAFTAEPAQVRKSYPHCREGKIVQQEIPPMNNDEGTICILDPLLNLLDEFHYREEQHYSLLASVAGVSLERISTSTPASDSLNWHSASSTCGFATPGCQNSQSVRLAEGAGFMELAFVLFSPDNDGEKDLLPVSLNLDQNGYTVRLLVYNAAGVPVREVARNDLGGFTALYTWDGLNDNRQLCQPGIYILLAEAVHPSGTRRVAKKACVLAQRF